MSRDVIVCPDCGYENLQGNEECASCSAPLVPLDRSPDRQRKTSITRDRIGDLPLGPGETMPATATVRQVVDRLAHQNDACVIVMDGDRVAGIMTERDVLYRVAGKDGIMDKPVSTVMTPDPVRVFTNDRVAAAFNKMAVGGIRHLPVFDGERLSGVITVTTLLRYLHEHAPAAAN